MATPSFKALQTLLKKLDKAEKVPVQPLSAVTYNSPALDQAAALRLMARRLDLVKVLDAQVGLFRRTVVVDVVLTFGTYELRTTAQANAYAILATKAMVKARALIEAHLPGLRNGFAPQVGVFDGAWRFQGNPHGR